MEDNSVPDVGKADKNDKKGKSSCKRTSDVVPQQTSATGGPSTDLITTMRNKLEKFLRDGTSSANVQFSSSTSQVCVESVLKGEKTRPAESNSMEFEPPCKKISAMVPSTCSSSASDVVPQQTSGTGGPSTNLIATMRNKLKKYFRDGTSSANVQFSSSTSQKTFLSENLQTCESSGQMSITEERNRCFLNFVPKASGDVQARNKKGSTSSGNLRCSLANEIKNKLGLSLTKELESVSKQKSENRDQVSGLSRQTELTEDIEIQDGAKLVARQRTNNRERLANEHQAQNSVGTPSLDSYGRNFVTQMKGLKYVTCRTCRERNLFLEKSKISCVHGKHCERYSASKLMDPGPVPVELSGLSYIEEQLIARVHPVISVYKIKGQQLGYSGNIINFPQAVHEFAKVLPWRVQDLPSIITVRTGDSVQYTDFHVQADRVRKALEWLQVNNKWYLDIDISHENIQMLPEDGNLQDKLKNFDASPDLERSYQKPPVMSERNEDDRDGTIEETGVPHLQTVHQDAHIRAVFDWPTISNEPLNEFKTRGLIPQAFPTLFPYGHPDLRSEEGKSITPVNFFKHLMVYEDQRFAKHPRFRFFAFNSTLRWRALSQGSFYVKKNSDLKNKTAQQLKHHLLSNPRALGNIMFQAIKLRGTKAYWKSKSFELIDMIEQLGLPTLFLTLSAADYQWPDLFKVLVPDTDPDTLTEKDRAKLIQENPLIVDTFFLKRVKEFFDKVIIPKFNVKDYWYRVEYQHRGSPHVHCLLWLKDSPDVTKLSEMTPEERQNVADYFDKFVSTYHPAPSTPRSVYHPCRKSPENIQNIDQDLAELLNRVQMHSCSVGYCKRFNKKTQKYECRFKFPQPLQDKSIIVMNENGDYEYFGRRNVDCLNKFNQYLIQIWRANMDISPILSYRALVVYLAKYVSKSESKSEGLQEFLLNCATGENSSKNLIQKILIRCCSERDFSAQEVCHLLMGHQLCVSSRDFVYVNIKKSADWEPVKENLCEDNSMMQQKSESSFIEKYAARAHSHLQNLSLWHIAQNYMLPSGKRRSKPAIVRVIPKLTLKKNGEESDDFYRMQVLLHVPWKDEAEFLSSSDTWKCVYERSGLHVGPSHDLLSAVTTEGQENEMEDLEEHEVAFDATLDEYMRASAMTPNVAAGKTELGKRDLDLQYNWNTSAAKYEQYGTLSDLQMFITRNKKGPDDPVSFVDFPNVNFNEEQRKVLNLLETQIASISANAVPLSGPKKVIVQGKAGTGKSLLIQAIKHKLETHFGKDSYLSLAPTGIAALNINGETIHSGLHIPPNLKLFKNLEGESARKFCDKMASIKFLILDEYSMVGSQLFSCLEERVRQGKGFDEDFGGVFVYLFGDIRQLPPVCDPPLYQLATPRDNAPSVRGKLLFSQFDAHIHLKQSHRQSDISFLRTLDNLSVGETTDEDYQLMKTRFVSKVSSEERVSFQDAVHLFPTGKEVSNFNINKLECLKCPKSKNPVPVAYIPAQSSGPGAEDKEDAEGLSKTLNLAVGAKIMLRANLWVSKGLVNGQIGEIIDILYAEGKSSPTSLPEVIICRFPGYRGPYLDDELKTVPIPAVTRYWSNPDGTNCSRKQFPLSISYACTIHKSQGLTLSKVVINIGNLEMTCGLTYVAFSRAKQVNGLLLMDFFPDRITKLRTLKGLKNRNQREKDIFSHQKDLMNWPSVSA